jgi:hypothetical protein
MPADIPPEPPCRTWACRDDTSPHPILVLKYRQQSCSGSNRGLLAMARISPVAGSMATTRRIAPRAVHGPFSATRNQWSNEYDARNRRDRIKDFHQLTDGVYLDHATPGDSAQVLVIDFFDT